MDKSIVSRLTGSRLRRLGFESFWIILGQSLAAIGGIIGVRILTGMLSPLVYGQLALAMSVVILIQTTVMSPLGATFTRFYAPSREQGRLPGFLRGVKRLLGEATTVILGATVIFGLTMMISGQDQWLGLLIAGATFSLFTGYSITMNGMQNAARQRAIVAWHRGLRVWLQLLLAIAAIYITGATSTAAMIGYAVSAIIVFGSQFFFFKIKILAASRKQSASPPQIYLGVLQKMRTYAWPLMAWGLFIWLRTSSDRWALQIFTSTYEVGLYEVLFQLGFYPVSLGMELILQLMIPVFYEVAGDATDPVRLAQVSRLNYLVLLLALGLTGLGVLAAFWLSGWIFSLFAAPEYRAVSWLLPYMILSAGLLISSQVAGQLIAVLFQTRSLLLLQIVTGVAGLLASFSAAYLWGLPGVVAAAILVAILRLLWVLKVRKDVLQSYILNLNQESEV